MLNWIDKLNEEKVEKKTYNIINKPLTTDTPDFLLLSLNQLKKSNQDFRREFDIKKFRNSQKEQLEIKLQNERDNYNELTEYKTRLQEIYKVAVKEYDEYKRRRIGFLNETITDSIQKIFPYDGYESRVVYENKFNNSQAYVVLKDKYGRERIPRYSEGGLLKELIGFTSAISVLKCLNSSTFLFDEAFGMASKNNKPKLGDMLYNCINDGVQMFLVSQTSELYDNINCRKIYLERNELTNETKVTKYIKEE